MVDKKYVYSFGGGDSEGSGSMKDLLGGKGANLAEMASKAAACRKDSTGRSKPRCARSSRSWA